MDKAQRRVVCAAMRRASGAIICSPRHHDELSHRQARATGLVWKMAEQGFVDQFGVFMTREEAWIVAFDAGQILRRVGSDTACLYSENLY